MEVQDGFIVGIFNYCDRWCERCPLTSRCRLFATLAEIGLEEGNGPLTKPRIVSERRRLEQMQRLRMSANPSVQPAIETITYYSLFVQLKMMRAFSQVARKGPGDRQSDANGSGKAALLGLERMERAWQTLIETQHYSAQEAAPFLAEIGRMQRSLHRALPNARSFVRPGFDEPDKVKMLERA